MGKRRAAVVPMNGPTLVILAAGRARRFGGIKPLAPIGPAGEAVIDLLAGDAVAAGFDRIILVVNPDTGPVIREHVAESWPRTVDVRFAVQERPLGTVHAVLAAREEADDAPFGVANADDLYGRPALTTLAEHLAGDAMNCLVAFRLDRALVGDDPVTRGVCDVADGRLVDIAERRQVTVSNGVFTSDDGLDPRQLDPASLVSMNLWGFAAPMWSIFADAMTAATDASEDAEVLLPEVVGRIVDGSLAVESPRMAEFHVLATESRCVGVTHPGDLEVVQRDIRSQIERGERSAAPFGDRS
ncbi:MAG: NTP transferase domain-containing protein [Actinomycetes bacterium]